MTICVAGGQGLGLSPPGMLGFETGVDASSHPYLVIPCPSAQLLSSCIGPPSPDEPPQISLCLLIPPHNWDRKARPTSCSRHQARTQLAGTVENPVPYTVYTILGLFDFRTLVKPVPTPPPPPLIFLSGYLVSFQEQHPV